MKVSELEVILALTGMGVALAGLLVAALVGGWVLRGLTMARRAARRAAEQTIDWPPTWEQILADNGGVPPLVSHKRQRRMSPNHHRLRCGVCGRFAARVEELPGVGQCRQHGMTMTGPITIISTERQDHEASHQLAHA